MSSAHRETVCARRGWAVRRAGAQSAGAGWAARETGGQPYLAHLADPPAHSRPGRPTRGKTRSRQTTVGGVL